MANLHVHVHITIYGKFTCRCRYVRVHGMYPIDTHIPYNYSNFYNTQIRRLNYAGCYKTNQLRH